MSREDRDAELTELASMRVLEALVPQSIAEADRREIVQEALSRLAQVPPARIRERSKFRSYAAQVLRHVVADWVAGRRFYSKHEPATTALLDEALLAGTYFTQGSAPAAPDEAYARREAHALVNAALRELPRTRRQILYLMRMEGLSAPEVAARLGLAASTVYSEFKLALTQFRTVILKRTGDGHRRRE